MRLYGLISGDVFCDDQNKYYSEEYLNIDSDVIKNLIINILGD